MKTNKDKKMFGKDAIKVDLLLQALLEEACVEGTSDTIIACFVLETLNLAEGSKWTSKSGDGSVTTRYMFIATDELREMLVSRGMLIDTMT